MRRSPDPQGNNRSGGRLYHLGGEGVGAFVGENHPGEIKSGGGADERAGIAGVLDILQQQDFPTGSRGRAGGVSIRRYLDHGGDSRRRPRAAEVAELAWGDLAYRVFPEIRIRLLRHNYLGNGLRPAAQYLPDGLFPFDEEDPGTEPSFFIGQVFVPFHGS